MDVGQTTQAASGKAGNPSSTEGESKQSLFLVAHHRPLEEGLRQGLLLQLSE